MTPCLTCHRHVREDICPFCGSKCVQSANSSFGRVARTALFAAGAVALSECSSEPAPAPMYGGACLADPDACVVVPQDAGSDASKDASSTDAPSEASSDAASTDASTDAQSDATSD